MKLAFCAIIKGVDEEAESFGRLIANVCPHVDKMFITVTHKPGERPSPRVTSIAREWGCEMSTFEWCDDFAAARNFNFSQVPAEYPYILWGDADDQFRGLEELVPALEAHPDVDAFGMFYLYAFDENKNPIVVHQKTQVIKNGAAIWEGYLHEDFKPLRKLTTFFIKGIERLHMTDGPRIAIAKERNYIVANKQVAEQPNDPRSYWNLGNAAMGCEKFDEAIESFKKFMGSSQSDEEKYLVRLRIAELLWKKGKKPEAIDEARYALGTKPEYPDAYHLLGSLYLESKQYERAKEMYTQGLLRKPPYYNIIVFNPRDYDYVPLMNLAKVYFQLNLPTMALVCLKACKKIMPKDKSIDNLIKLIEKEARQFNKVAKMASDLQKITDKDKLKAELDKVPAKYKAHPAIVNIRNINFIKETSSGKDLVFFCGYTDEVWTPATVKTKGIGGSEEAIIWLSKLLTEKGWNITVYNNCGAEESVHDGVTFKPYWSWNYRDKQDVVVLWRHPHFAQYEINASRVFVDLHDVIDEGEFTPERLKRITKIFVKSNFHRSLFPNIPDEKFVIVPNGIDSDLFTGDFDRDPYLLINTSSPDRGLRKAVELFERVKAQVPAAKMMWAYGWGVWDVAHGENAKVMAWKDEMIAYMERAGVQNLGRISHAQVAELYQKASVFAYPSEFAEIDCISLSKAMAAGAIPVTTDFAAMGDKKGHGGVFLPSPKTKDNWVKPYQFDFSMEGNDDAWVEAVVAIMKSQPTNAERSDMRAWALQTFDWNKIANRWDHELR